MIIILENLYEKILETLTPNAQAQEIKNLEIEGMCIIGNNLTIEKVGKRFLQVINSVTKKST